MAAEEMRAEDEQARWRESEAKELYDKLVPLWGERAFTPYFDDMLSAVVGSILSQRTNYPNQRRAHDRMMQTFETWQGVAEADTDALAEAIQASTFPEVKAPAIQRLLRALHAEQGRYDLNFLKQMSAEEGFKWLTSFKGIGEKTASFALLFHLGKPVLPVDTHVGRVSKRYGLIPAKASAKKAHRLLNEMMPQGDAYTMYNFHRVLFKHGQRVCTYHRPRCARCPVRQSCPSSSC